MKRCLIYFITILFVSSIFLAGCSSSSSDSEKKVNKVELTIYSWKFMKIRRHMKSLLMNLKRKIEGLR